MLFLYRSALCARVRFSQVCLMILGAISILLFAWPVLAERSAVPSPTDGSDSALIGFLARPSVGMDIGWPAALESPVDLRIASKSAKKKAKTEEEPSEIPFPPPPPKSAEDVLEFTLLEPTTGPLQQGSLIEFTFLVRNSTEDVVVLKEFGTDNDEDIPITFVISGYGTVTYDEQGQRYVYDTMAQLATPKIFHHGIMLPGESRRITITIRVLKPRQTVKARFYRLPMKDFRRVTFAPIEGGEGKKIVFQHLQSLPEDYLKPRTSVDGPIQDRPFIMWEDLQPEPIEVYEQSYVRETPLTPLSLSAEQAVEIAGFDGLRTYWEWAGGWVLMSGRSAAMVTPEQKRPLPRVDRRLFRDIDSGKERIRVKLTAGGEIFKTRFMTRGGDGVYTFGDFIEVPRARLWEFFDLVRGENFQITRETYLFDAYYYVLTPRP